MKLKTISEIKTIDEARQTAIDFQEWMNNENLSYSEILKYQGFFETLAKKFKLTEEFKENGII